MKPLWNMAAGLGMLAALPAQAQKSSADAIAEYRKMLEDGNPADLFEAKGEALWKQKRGPKNASLEQCDLGKGAGVVKGAFVELPRYFADTGKVQDLESRLVTCMATLQGFNAEEIAKTPFGRGEQQNVTALATYVAAASRGLRFNLPQSHSEERRMYEIGKAVNMASHFEIDDVIDPMESRARVASALASAAPPEPRTRKKRPCVDSW